LAAIIAALVFLAVSLLVAAVLRPQATPQRDRAADYLSGRMIPDHGSRARGRSWPSFAQRVVRPTLTGLGRGLSAATPAGVVGKIRAKLDMAGNPSHLGVTEYVGLRVLSIAVVIPLGIVAVRALDVSGPALWLSLLLIAGVGIWLPDVVLQRVIEARQLAIRRALPDVLDLMVVGLEAGMGFDQATSKVIEKNHGPLAEELARVLKQIGLGKSRSEALRTMAERTQVPDLTTFVAAVQQSETLGVSIANTLRVQADTARERRSQRAREAAAKLPVKLLFPLVFFIFPALFVVVLGPGAVRFAQLFEVLGK
jgi:tight adherence protein C